MPRKLIFGWVLISLAAAPALAQFGPSTVVVNKVIERPVAPVQTFVATVMPLRKSVVGSAVDGRVDQFLFDEQNPQTKLTYVRAGQPLANLKEETVRILLDAAVALRDLRQAEYAEASETHQDLIVQMTARLEGARAAADYARARQERNKQLYQSSRSISLDELELSRSLATKAQKELEEATILQKLMERTDKIIQAKARLDEAQANVLQLEDRLKKFTIRAPFDGFVVAEHTEVGEWIKEGDPVAEVVQLNPIEVRAFVPEKYVSQLTVGSEVTVHPSASLPQGQAAPVGRVTGVIAEAVSGSRTFPVKIQVPNPNLAAADSPPNYLLKAGMLAEVALQIGAPKTEFLVPKDALFLDERLPNPQIFLAVADAKSPTKFKAAALSVEKGAALGNWIAVRPLDGELKAGDLVVEKGNERVMPNAPLAVNHKGATAAP
jgi:RND family efflux transporter MFP subunit